MENQEVIAEVWLWRTLRTYPCQNAEFLARERDPFRNPVGSTVRRALTSLLDELLHGMDTARIAEALDALMQIQAIQDLAPSRAIEFLFQLKDLLRHQTEEPELALLNGRIDEMALRGFDLYMKYRERTYQARMNEARRRVFVMERRLEVCGAPAWRERGEQ
jgi:hypothetical protein